MGVFLKRTIASVLSLALIIGTGITVHAAPIYSIKVEDNNVSFVTGDKVFKTYPAQTTAITITADSGGSLMACFFNAKGTYSRIKFGKQSALAISGKMTSLSLSNPLSDSLSITLPSDADIATVNMNAGGNLTIGGRIETLNVGGNSAVTLTKGANISYALLTGADAKLTAPSGTSVYSVDTANGASASGAGLGSSGSSSDSNNTNSSGTQGDGVIELSISSIRAYEGDRLSDLLGELEDNVQAYTVKNDDQIYGSVKWTSSGSTVVNRTGTFSFTFTPDDSRYSSLRGSMRILIGDSSASDSDVTLKITQMTVTPGKRLRDLSEALASNVRAYNAFNERIDGMVSWSDTDTTRVSEKGTYKFIFTPTNTIYNEISDSIVINPSSSSSSSSSNTSSNNGQTIEAIPIDADSGSTLSNLSNQLKSNVTVYDQSGDKINGTVKWVANSTTKIRDGKFYAFNFTPTSNRFRTMRGEIQVVAGGGSGSSGSGSSTITGPRMEVKGSITADSDGRRLREYTTQTEDLLRAYDSRGNSINGVIEWVIDDYTRVEKTGVYQFRFLPDRSSDTLRGQVLIVVKGNELELKATSFNTVADRRLRDLTSLLQSNVRAVNADGRSVSGKASWNQSDSTYVSKSGTYTFLFTPDSSQYEPVDGEVKINIGSGGGNSTRIKVQADDIHISTAQYLNDLKNELTNSVTVYDEYGSRIRGTATWKDTGDPRVTRTGTYTFVYTPNDAQYGTMMGDVTISVGSKRSGQNLSLDIVPFNAKYNDRISDLTSELEEAIVAYDYDNNKVSGRVRWVTSTSTKTRRTDSYQFLFTPTNSRYRTTGGWITIIVED